ncbi:MAG: hypothetical protein ACXWUX_00680 [Allosphingosinicella sp.]
MVVCVRGFPAFAALLCGQLLAAMNPAHATTPDPSWRGVERVYVVAQLTAPIDSTITSDDFCERVRRIAAEGAPFPVQCVTLGEAAAAEAAGDAVIVVQAAIQPVDGHPLLVVSARRTAEAGLEPSPLYLGAPPRAARLTDAAAGETTDSALREALAQILPWLVRP